MPRAAARDHIDIVIAHAEARDDLDGWQSIKKVCIDPPEQRTGGHSPDPWSYGLQELVDVTLFRQPVQRKRAIESLLN
jgi:hypothetical protein